MEAPVFGKLAHRVILFLFLIFIPAVSADDIKDVKPPVDIPVNYLWFYIGLAALVAAAGILLWQYFFKNRRGRSVPVTKSAWVVALERLEELRKQDLPGRKLIKEYYTQLSDITRRYIEDRFHIKAPEMTTQEFLWSLKNSQDLLTFLLQKTTLRKSILPFLKERKVVILASTMSLVKQRPVSDEQKNLLSDFLNSCDLVKFAKYGPTVREMDASFQSAKRLIE